MLTPLCVVLHYKVTKLLCRNNIWQMVVNKLQQFILWMVSRLFRGANFATTAHPAKNFLNKIKVIEWAFIIKFYWKIKCWTLPHKQIYPCITWNGYFQTLWLQSCVYQSERFRTFLHFTPYICINHLCFKKQRFQHRNHSISCA